MKSLNKVLVYLSIVALAVLAGTAQAGIIGHLDATDHGNNEYTWVFDQLASDINGDTDGIMFSAFGISMVATANCNTCLVQDTPANGGLGVYGGSRGDNLDTDEWIMLTFDTAVTLTSFSLNGLVDSDGHTDLANGSFTLNGINGNASDWSTIGQNTIGHSAFAVAQQSFLFEVSSFHGYIESVTFSVSPGTTCEGGGTCDVPEPGTLLIFLTAMVGMVGRKYLS